MAPSFLLADDLSGALETGGVWSAAGWRVVLPLDPAPPATAAATAGCLHVVSTETRNVGPAAAELRIRLLLQQYRSAGWRLAGKKIDSTLRGPVGAELEAVWEVWRPPLIVVAPTNPVAGRTVRDGVLLVNGTPVSETAFARDPLWPVTDSRIDSWLGVQGWARCRNLSGAALASVGRIASELGECRRAGVKVVIADAESNEHLADLATAIRQVCPDAVVAGSAAALAMGVASPPAGSVGRDQPESSGVEPRRMLFLLGSRHPIGVEQGRRLLATGEVAEWSGSREPPPAAVCQLSTLPDIDANGVRERAAGLARQWLGAHPGGEIFVTGGEIARVVAGALEGEQLEGATLVEPGVARTVLTRGGRPVVPLWVKPGGFGDADTLIRCWIHQPQAVPQ